MGFFFLLSMWLCHSNVFWTYCFWWEVSHQSYLFFLPFICHFSFGALKSLSFSNLSIVKVVVIFFLFILLKIHSASWIYNLKFFTKLGTFCHYFSKYFLFQIVPFPFLLSLGPQLCECWDYIVPQISEVLSTFLIVLQIG